MIELDSELHVAEFKAARAQEAIAALEAANDVEIRYADMSSQVSKKVFERSDRAQQQYAKSISKTELEQ